MKGEYHHRNQVAKRTRQRPTSSTLEEAGLPPLWDDFLTARARLHQSSIAGRLANASVTTEARLRVGGIGIADVSTSGRLFEPTEPGLGLEAVIIPVFSGPIPSRWRVVEQPALIDLLAFSLDRPQRWWLRRDAGTILGDGALDDLWLDALLFVFRTPLAWLRAAGKGIVLLGDRETARRELPLTSRRICAEDVAHGNELRRQLTVPAVVPDICVPRAIKATA